MDEPSAPVPGGQPGSTEPSLGKTKVLGLDYKIAGLLAYLPLCAINLVCSIIWLLTEPKENRFLRFHAMQSVLLAAVFIGIGVVVWAVTMVLAFIPFAGFLVAIVNIAWYVAVIVYIWKCVEGMLAAYRGQMKKIEYVGDVAERTV
ncbi:MAG TPA: Tic20 family protein [Candidatus Obscuribacterales bacterium]